MDAPNLVETPLRPVRAATMDWEPLGTHGLRRKRLGFDPATQHTTSLVEIPKGWHGGGIAHFHEAFEEVLMLTGSVTLDGRHYWTAGDYFYRPAFIVHGHDEKSPEGALTVIRSDGVLELLLVHRPEQDVEYPLPRSSDPRGHVFQMPIATVPGAPDPLFPSEWRIRPLSADAQGGARTLIADIPAGWSGTTPALGVAWEAMVLAGAVRGGAHDYAVGDYTAAGADVGPLDAVASDGGASVMLWLFGRP